MTLAPPDMLCFSLYSAAHAVQAAYAPLLAPLGLTYPQFLVLTALGAADRQTVGQLGAVLRLDSNTLTPILKRMEAAGWLHRRRDPQDERQVRLTLTEAGRGLAARLGGVQGSFLDRSGMTPDAARDLRDAVVALRDRLKE